jgi:glycolate oxidase iron-sulfur subunit
MTTTLPRNGAAHSTLSASQHALLASEYDNMLSCVRCGLCLTSCPTYVLSLHEAEGPRGRVAMARALLEGHLEITPDLVEHEQNCLVCDACTDICPAGVHMDPLQAVLRSVLDQTVSRPPWQRAIRAFVFRRLFPNMALFRTVVRLIGLYQSLGLQWLARHLGILQLLGLKETEAFLPHIPARFVVPQGETYPANASVGATSPVSFFAGCVMSTALADVDRATIRVLQRAGCDVVNSAGQGCCGALNAHGGDLQAARELMKRNIAAYERDGDSAIVVNSAGCGAMLKDYAHHLRDDPAWAERARAFTARVRDVTEFLATRDLPFGPATAPSADSHAPDATGSSKERSMAVVFQDPCHLAHAQRISQQPRALLRSIPGIELREMGESGLCCGSAGIYNVTNPDESRRLQQRKLDNALATGAQTIVTANPGCLLQLQSGLRERKSDVQVKHIVEVLDEAMER